jgi:hypothetical protein
MEIALYKDIRPVLSKLLSASFSGYLGSHYHRILHLKNRAEGRLHIQIPHGRHYSLRKRRRRARHSCSVREVSAQVLQVHITKSVLHRPRSPQLRVTRRAKLSTVYRPLRWLTVDPLGGLFALFALFGEMTTDYSIEARARAPTTADVNTRKSTTTATTTFETQITFAMAEASGVTEAGLKATLAEKIGATHVEIEDMSGRHNAICILLCHVIQACTMI